MARKTRNIGASVRARLLTLAQRKGTEYQLLVTRYALERLLYRLGVSPHRDRFVLKGAMLFAIWLDDPFRPTRDVDFLGFGDPAIEAMAAAFREICRVDAAEDGVAFDADGVRAEAIRKDVAYGGVRVQTQAAIGGMRVPIRIDIGFGDAVTPGPQEVEYPALLDAPPPRLRAYPRETVIAEKFEAIVSLGLSNSRMKDFHDIWILSEHFAFERSALAAAIRATFERRGTRLPAEVPPGLGDEFAADPLKTTQWAAFLRRESSRRRRPRARGRGGATAQFPHAGCRPRPDMRIRTVAARGTVAGSRGRIAARQASEGGRPSGNSTCRPLARPTRPAGRRSPWRGPGTARTRCRTAPRP